MSLMELMKTAGLVYAGDSIGRQLPWLRRDVIKGIEGNWFMDGKEEVFKPYSVLGIYSVSLYRKENGQENT